MCYSKAQGGLRCESHVRKELVRLYQDDFAQAEREARLNNYDLVSEEHKDPEVAESKQGYRDARAEEKAAWKRIDENVERIQSLPNQPTAQQKEDYKDPMSGELWDMLAFERESPMLVESYYKSEDAADKIKRIEEQISPERLKENLNQDIGNMLASLPTKRRKELNEIGRGRLLSKEALRKYQAAVLEEAKSHGIETDFEAIRASRKDELDALRAERKEHKAEFNKLSNYLASRRNSLTSQTNKGLPDNFIEALEKGRQSRHPMVMEELAHERLITECYYATQNREHSEYKMSEAAFHQKEKPAERALVQKYRQEVWSKTYDGMENQRRMNELKIQIAITPTRMKKLAKQIEADQAAGKDASKRIQQYNKLSSYRNNLMQKNILEAKIEEQEKNLL